MQIGDFDVQNRVLLVAELGNNHEGRFDVARKLVETAAECGVPAVKFQTFRTEYYVSRSDAARFQRLKSFELTQDQFRQLADLAHSKGMLFLSTPFDLESARFLEEIVDAYKVASGDIAFYPMIRQIARTGKPVILSTGGSDLKQVQQTVSILKREWKDSKRNGVFALLHCVSSYPVPAQEANLRSIHFLAEHFQVPVGYSDHTLGIEASLLAVAIGARIVEKHFTLDKHFSDFRDHQLSATPAEIRELLEKIQRAETLLGKAGKAVQACEQAVVPTIRRSIVACRDLPAGHLLGLEDLTWIRPAGGLAPGEEAQLIGRHLKRAIPFGEPLLPSDIQ